MSRFEEMYVMYMVAALAVRLGRSLRYIHAYVRTCAHTYIHN